MCAQASASSDAVDAVSVRAVFVFTLDMLFIATPPVR